MLERSGVAERFEMVNFVNLFVDSEAGFWSGRHFNRYLCLQRNGHRCASVVLLAMLSMPVMLEQKYSPPSPVVLLAFVGNLGFDSASIMLIIMADQLSLFRRTLIYGAPHSGVITAAPLYIRLCHPFSAHI